jgi:heptaprenyl diphosphate synthase
MATVGYPDRGTSAYRRPVAGNPLTGLPGMDDNLGRVEERLTEWVRADDDFLTEVASHLITAGGKRVRPALTMAAALSADADLGSASEESVLGGVSVELVHLGSLYHDDVMDDATTRRTVESVNARWGNLKAILAGDFLLARASEIAAGLGTEVAGLLAATIARLCEGQVRELKDAYVVGRTEDAYLASIEGKTAALFASSCRIGGIVAGFERDRIEALTRFGRAYGMAFQVIDDVLDVVASSEQLGKPAGHDLVEGVYTLPTLRALQGPSGPELADLLGHPLEQAEVDKALGLIRSDGAVAASLVDARAYVDEGRGALDDLGSSPVVDAMAAASDVLVAQIDDFDV